MDGNFADLTLPDKVSIIDTVQTRIQNGQWSIQWNRRERISEIVNGVCGQESDVPGGGRRCGSRF